MEVVSPPSSAGSRRGGGDREEAGGAMRARVCARVRTPQGVGALLLVGGAIVGAAVVAWRRRGERKNAKNQHRGKEEEKVPDSGVVENEQDKFDKSDENLSREDTEVEARVEANILDGQKTEELHEIQAKVDEIVADELDSEPAEKFDPTSSRDCTEIINDTVYGDMKKADQNSSMTAIENKITPNATEDVENPDESILTISSQDIAHEEHTGHDDGADEGTSSTQITPITQMAAHQPQIADEVKVENMVETVTVNVVSNEEQKPPAKDPVAPADSPAGSSLPNLLKTAQKKRTMNPRQNETGMKLGQDSSNGELSKGGAAHGVTVVTTNRRAASMAILALIFAVTIGLNLVMRLYSTLQAA